MNKLYTLAGSFAVRSFLFFTLFIFVAASCDLFEYNPNQIILEEDEKDLNKKNMAKIKVIAPPDTLKFILMGDTQRFYDESDAFIKSANLFNDVSFVVHAGDISDFGLTQELIWVNDIMKNLKFPYLTVVGNHDLLANGKKAYRRMFGAFDYAFEYGDNRFIFINTNSREYAFDGTVPDLDWLREQLGNNPENKNTIIISHMPPYDIDFDEGLEMEFARLLAEDEHVRLSLHGHQHSFNDSVFYDDGVRYFVTTSMNKRGYALISVWEGGYAIEKISY